MTATSDIRWIPISETGLPYWRLQRSSLAAKKPKDLPEQNSTASFNADDLPREFRGWKMQFHRRMGQQEWRQEASGLWLYDDQKSGRKVAGKVMRSAVLNHDTLNLCHWVFLMKNPELIPKAWEDWEAVFFWGTVLEAGGICPVVFFLHFSATAEPGDEWGGGYYNTYLDFSPRWPAAIQQPE